ncbi:MAG TPA: PAS domain S-box protein [Balneolaceae bacterium]|nr:PAS domain S-box protein [Balneolaceae bacterium]
MEKSSGHNIGRAGYEKILQNLHEGYLLVDQSARIYDANKAYCRLTGYSKEELCSMKLTDLRGNISSEELLKLLNSIAEDNSKSFESQHRTKNGKLIELNVSAASVNIDGKTYIAGMIWDVTDRNKAHRKMLNAKKRFKSLFEHNPHSVYIMDPEGNFLDINSKMEELSGYSRSELLDLDFVPMISDKDLERTQYHFKKAAEGEVETFEIVGVTKQGREIPVRVTNFPMIVDDHIIGVFGVAEDISERRKAKEKLQESEERWRRVVENNPQCVIICIDEAIQYINQAGARIFGCDNPDEIIGQSQYNFAHPDDWETIKARDAQLMNKQKVPPKEQRIIDVKGNIKNVIVYSIPIHYKGETAIQSVLVDVTAHKLAEQKIRSSESLKASILQTAIDAIVTINHEGRIIEFNKAAEEMFGHDISAVIGKMVHEVIIPEEYKQQHVERLQRYLQTGEGKILGQRRRMRAQRADGSIFPVEVSINRIKNTDPPKFTAFIRDITDRVKKENRIQSALEEKEIMLQEIHHRVKNNMAIVSGLMELQRFRVEDKKLQGILRESQMRIRSMAMIHEKLYASESLAKINFKNYIQELTERIVATTSTNQKDITVHYRLDEVHLSVNDAIPCGLILNELITNVYEHAFKNKLTGNILIRLKQQDHHLQIAVEDNGCGLPDDFDIDNRQTLGLTLIKTLVKQLNGELRIQQGIKNMGVCFEIFFQIE